MRALDAGNFFKETVSVGHDFFGTAFLGVLLLLVNLGTPGELVPVWPLVLAAGLMTALAMELSYLSIKRIGPTLAAGMLAAAPVHRPRMVVTRGAVSPRSAHRHGAGDRRRRDAVAQQQAYR